MFGVIEPCPKWAYTADKTKRDQKWCLFTSDGSRVIGRHSSQEKAERQERAIQWRKHMSQLNGLSTEAITFSSLAAVLGGGLGAFGAAKMNVSPWIGALLVGVTAWGVTAVAMGEDTQKILPAYDAEDIEAHDASIHFAGFGDVPPSIPIPRSVF
jgi:hypothetical protein